MHPSSLILRESRHEGGFNLPECQRISEEVMECVREWDSSQLVDLAQKSFRSYCFFAISALGEMPDPDLRAPVGLPTPRSRSAPVAPVATWIYPSTAEKVIEVPVKQLYYTSCEAGKSVGGSSGFQVRAASFGLSPDRIRAALRYVGYSLPPTMEPTESTAATAPVRLALLDTPDVGRLLCQSRYVGKDPTTGRYGNFFTHLLFDVPDELDGGRAILCWGNSFWRHSDGDFDTELPEMSCPK